MLSSDSESDNSISEVSTFEASCGLSENTMTSQRKEHDCSFLTEPLTDEQVSFSDDDRNNHWGNNCFGER